MSKYEVVIGIETHVQLATKTKLFCGCSNDSRDAPPNTRVCPVCIALPGALPVLNKRAVELALRVGIALNGQISTYTKFDRKNYFYPDNPSGYQITQYDQPIVGKGYVEFPLGGRKVKIGVIRAHLEADAGKLIHPAGKNYSLVDLNRAGTPLMEIVSDPDIRTAAEAKAYAQELYHLMRYAGVSDADLYYGNMRFDVNLSLRPAGSKEFGTRTETKNLNSFRAVFSASEYEIKRQTELLEKGEKIVQETRGWNEDKQVTFSQRSKEEAHDYRYFPEPDLPPIVVSARMLNEAKKSMPEMMPSDIRNHLGSLNISPSDIEVIVGDVILAKKFIETMEGEDSIHAQRVVNWMVNDIMADKVAGNFVNWDIDTIFPNVKRNIELSKMIEEGKISPTNAKKIVSTLVLRDIDPLKYAEKEGLLQISDTTSLEKIVDHVINNNIGPVEQYKAGETKVIGFLVGQVMKASKGQANPPMVDEILRRKLKL